ncbi:MAG: DMT family transporter [Bacteroidales bacterium]
METVKRAEGLILAVISNVLFGFALTWSKQSLDGYTPISALYGRVLIAVIFLFLWGLITHGLQPIKKKDAWHFILGAIFLPFLFYILIFEGLEHVDAILGGILFSTVTLMSPIAAHFFFREKFRKYFFIGLILSFLGVVFSLTSGKFSFSASPIGVILLILSSVSYVMYTVMVKKLSYRKYNSLSIIFYFSLIGLVFLIPVLIYDWPNFMAKSHSESASWAIFFMGFLSSFIGFVMYARSVKLLGAGKAMLFVNLVPVFGAVSALFILGERFTIHKLVGLIVVVIGLYVSDLKAKKKV